VDDQNFEVNTNYNDVKRDNGAVRVWEWIDVPMDKEKYQIIKAIIESKKTILRYQGDTYYQDRIITDTEKQALQNVLNAYEAMGGNVTSL
jgi:hypothetical protein